MLQENKERFEVALENLREIAIKEEGKTLSFISLFELYKTTD